MVVVKHVSKYFGSTKAVDDISFEVKEGENFILLGTSGCGKTTTLRMINRLIEPTKGTISVNGADITTQSPDKLRRGIGYVLQQNGLFPHYTVAENIATVPKLMNWDKQKIVSRSKEIMQKVHLSYDSYAHCYPDQLSGGQQQRVNVARALAADPPVLLMDEPFGALDPVTRSNIRKEFSELDEFKRKTILMVTHDVQEAFALGDKICLMDKGKIMQIGTPVELLFHPANDFVKDFLAEQYLQLALRTTTIKNIWEQLSTVTGDAAQDNAISVDTSLWEILESVTKNGNKNALIIKNDKNELRQLKPDELLNVFNQYKNN
ncbi:MAG TPA: ABC transporter ATP-binding protein [Flavipsychrobacter sp.]|nr:ABC transporter ATP-binding protein [Flavipsychrobacter sp.]